MLDSPLSALLDVLDSVVLGQRDNVRLILAAWLSGGHVLLDDVPGVAKTRVARALSGLTGLSFARIQGTPDLLPQDVTGSMIYDMKSGDLSFRKGPAFHHLVLMDEINRLTPRTQSALLECMEEKQITVDGVSHALPHPFLVIATQNPIDMEGTFPLPEAELDRFLICLSLGYPSRTDEKEIVQRFSRQDPLAALTPQLSPTQWQLWVDEIAAIEIGEATLDYLVDLCRSTREHPLIRLGASPRATLRFAQLARSYAWTDNRQFVTPDDIKYLAPFVLSHRIEPASGSDMDITHRRQLISDVVTRISVPVE